MISNSRKLFYIFVSLSFLLAIVGVQPVYAASIVVNTSADNLIDDGLCTLREAITTANSDSGINTGDCTTGAGADTINFSDDYTIGLVGSQLPVITDTLIINGNGVENTIIWAHSIPNAATKRVFEVNSMGNLTLNSLTIKHGNCQGSCSTSINIGGGILNNGTLTVTDSAISANSAVNGGGIFNNGTLTITGSTFSENSATNNGSGIFNNGTLTITGSTFSENSATAIGGGIINYGTLTIIGSTFFANSAFVGGGIGSEDGTLVVTNSTFSTNSASSASGGAIYNSTPSGTCASVSAATIANSTFSANSAIEGGAINNNNGVITLLFNTITASSSGGGVLSFNDEVTCTKAGGNIIFGNTGYDVRAGETAQRFSSLGYNLVGVAGTNVDFSQEFNATGDLTGNSYNPMLGALGNNGGSTQTHALLDGSDAVNAGGNTTCATSPINSLDQRGITRPQGINCDIGAYEKSGGTLPTSPTFGDVPLSHPYFADIEILYANGFTAGCSTSPLMFCPETTMNRAQAAVFMLRGNFGAGYLPPAPPWNTFSDDFSPGSWAQSWVQGMWNAGLTGGCSTSPMLYCPWEDMPRMQVAVFALRLMHGSSYVPPAGTGTVFADITDPTLWYAGWAEQAYADGLLPACGSSAGKPLFCPNELVSRGLGAFAIVKAKNLSMP